MDMPQARTNLDAIEAAAAQGGGDARLLRGRECHADQRRSEETGLTDASGRAGRQPSTRAHAIVEAAQRRPMSERTLIKDAIVLTLDPDIGELPRADILIEDGKIAAVGPNLSADGAKVIDADRRHRHPGLHRHPPPHLGDVDPDLRAGLRADHLLRVDPRQVRAALPAGRRARREPLGRARVRQRGHHDARRLVAHHEHAGPRGRGDPRPPGPGIRSVFAYGFGTRRSSTGGSGRTTRAAS